MTNKNQYKKYDILEIVWLDSHSGGGWKTPVEVKKWIEIAEANFTIKSIGYFIHEDNNFLRIAQSYDNQILDPEGQGDNNVDGVFAIAKTAIKSIKKIKIKL